MRFRLLTLILGATMLGCPSLPDPPCQVGRSDFSAYLVQLRPEGSFPPDCPQGHQYQVLLPSLYREVESDEPSTVVFHLAGSGVDPPERAQALGRFSSRLAPPSGVCTVDALTPATDDGATPVNAPVPVGATTYAFSGMQVLSDTVHRGNQLQAKAIVDYGITGCSGLPYVAQAIYPLTPCLNDSICLPEPVGNDVQAPAGRSRGSGLSPDSRVFCNLDPALLDNQEILFVLNERFWFLFNAPFFTPFGRGAYTDPDGGTHDVGICFYSEPFPSQCPGGSTLSTSGPCVVGPGSNPH